MELLLLSLLCSVWLGGVEQRLWVVVGGVGDRTDVGGHKNGGGWEGKGFVCS